MTQNSIEGVGGAGGVASIARAASQVMMEAMTLMLQAASASQNSSPQSPLQSMLDGLNSNQKSAADQMWGSDDGADVNGVPGASGASGSGGLGDSGQSGGLIQALLQIIQIIAQLMQMQAQQSGQDGGGGGESSATPSANGMTGGFGSPFGSPVEPSAGGGSSQGSGPFGTPASWGSPSSSGGAGPTPPANGTPAPTGPTSSGGSQGPGDNSPVAADGSSFTESPTTGKLSEEGSKKMAVDTAARLQKDFGLTKEQAAGVVGNLYHESEGMNSNVNELGSDPNSPQYGAPNSTQFGYGWAQWTGTRKQDFLDFAKSQGLDPSSPEANYQMLKHELQGSESATLGALKGANTPEEAAVAFRKVFERATNPVDTQRINEANNVLNWMG